MNDANYRKHNDRTRNSSTYHKKDGTAIRSILKREAEQEIAEELTEDADQQHKSERAGTNESPEVQQDE